MSLWGDLLRCSLLCGGGPISLLTLHCCHFDRVDKKRDKIERKILDSQERAFWDVHRPVVSKLTCFPELVSQGWKKRVPWIRLGPFTVYPSVWVN